jgi:organic radical activating enzyme
MFGDNPIEKPEEGRDGFTLHIVQGSPFLTIQGEGPFAGQSAVFVRLHGCNLHCSFCDTEFSAKDDPRIKTDDLIDLVVNLAKDKTHLVVITGGEPTLQPLGPLVDGLRKKNLAVQVETNGTIWQDALNRVYVVVSPKTPRINEEVATHTLAYKYIINATEPFNPTDGLSCHLAVPLLPLSPSGPEVYLNPMDEYDETKNKANAKETGRRALMYGYRAGIQLHKILDLQ